MKLVCDFINIEKNFRAIFEQNTFLINIPICLLINKSEEKFSVLIQCLFLG